MVGNTGIKEVVGEGGTELVGSTGGIRNGRGNLGGGRIIIELNRVDNLETTYY